MNTQLLRDDDLPDWAYTPSEDEKKRSKAEIEVRKAERKAAKEAQKRAVSVATRFKPPHSIVWPCIMCILARCSGWATRFREDG